MQLHTLTLTQAHRLLAAKEISSVELTRAVLDRIAAVDPQVHAYITVAADEAYVQESILKPQAKIVAGYSPVMPTFERRVVTAW